MVALSLTHDDHEIIPEPGSARRVRDGKPAGLTRVTDYPVEAICLVCGQPIRRERWLLAEWRHLGPGPGSD